MIRLYLIFTLIALATRVHAQNMELKDLLSFTELSSARAENVIIRHKYKPLGVTGDGSKLFQQIRGKADSVSLWMIELKGQDNGCQFTFRTSDSAAYLKLLKEMKIAGFAGGVESNPFSASLYQKAGFLVQTSRVKQDSLLLWSTGFRRVTVPAAKDILRAEDLTRIKSEAIAREVFSPTAVISDYFFFSSKDSVACAVIFPNSPSQAVIVWKDPVNRKDIAFVGVGIEPRPDKQKQSPKFLSNKWVTGQGIFCGMDLRDLLKLNGKELKFYNWQSDAAGMVILDKEDKLQSDWLTIELGCFNCEGDQSRTEVISSVEALSKYQKVYVRSFVIVPRFNW